jgi:molybdopterin/thiamine biosynthesis adenylyltransferase
MADGPKAGTQTALERVHQWLLTNANARPLTEEELAQYTARGADRGWRFQLDVEGQIVDLDLTVDNRFPRSRPRVGLSKPPPFPSYPHVESDGRLCIIEDVDELDHTKPTGIIKAVLKGAAEVLEEGLTGRNEDDFRDEFLSYWDPTAKGPTVFSLADPCGSSRRVKLWCSGKNYVAAEDRRSMSNWLKNRTGRGLAEGEACQPALILWFDQPLLPNEYPSNPADLCALADKAGGSAPDLLRRYLAEDICERLVLLGAQSKNGPCFAAVTIQPHPSHRRNSVRARRKGNPAKPQPSVILAEVLRGALIRHRVERVDPQLIHGRDSNRELDILLASKVIMLGCGSLGGYIARTLAQAGVGEIVLIDPDVFEPANSSRHVLGGECTHGHKAQALAVKLRREFPHTRFEHHNQSWQLVADKNSKKFQQADLVVSTIGSWSHEGEFNARQVNLGHPSSTLYAWTEPFGAAAHAVIVGSSGGCLACGLTSFGEPMFKAAQFSGDTLRQMAACGSYFQPYGASEINSAANLAADLAIDHLLDRAPVGSYRVLSARQSIVERSGGIWTPEWERSTLQRPSAALVEMVWRQDLACSECGRSRQ